MKDICPVCEKETEIERISTDETVTVRGEKITVPVVLFKCSVCGESFEDPLAQTGPVELAYAEYRKRKGLLQPDEIKAFRSRFGLTQAELGKLLGFGGASISRYENGALQDEAHDKALRLAMNVQNLVGLVERTPSALTPSRRADLLKRLGAEEASCELQSQVDRLGRYAESDLSGFKTFDYTKFLNAVLFFSKDGAFTTCLNKFLFYADFLHFKRFSVSMTGLRYAHMPFGPAPDKFMNFFALLTENGIVDVEEVNYDGGSGVRFKPSIGIDTNVFEESELRCLLAVKAAFEGKSSKEMSDYSHEEEAWRSTKNGDLIPYTLAERLSLDLT